MFRSGNRSTSIFTNGHADLILSDDATATKGRNIIIRERARRRRNIGIFLFGWLSLFTEFAAGTFVELTTEAFFHKVVQPVTERFELHVVDDFVDEGILKQQFSLSK